MDQLDINTLNKLWNFVMRVPKRKRPTGKDKLGPEEIQRNNGRIGELERELARMNGKILEPPTWKSHETLVVDHAESSDGSDSSDSDSASD